MKKGYILILIGDTVQAVSPQKFNSMFFTSGYSSKDIHGNTLFAVAVKDRHVVYATRDEYYIRAFGRDAYRI